MADDFLSMNVNVGGLASSAASSLVDVIFWLLLILIVIGALIGGVWFFSFKHRVRVRKVLKSGRSLIIDDKARQFKDKNGAVWWKLLKTNVKVAEPPVEALEVNSKGKIYAEAYLVRDGVLVWKNNDFDYAKLVDNKADFVNSGYDALTSEERALYASEHRDAETHKKKKISELLAVAAPYIAIIMIFALFLIFFSEVVAPAKEMSELIRASNADFKEAMSILRDVVQDRQTMSLGVGEVPN
jgi:hypothetical protein